MSLYLFILGPRIHLVSVSGADPPLKNLNQNSNLWFNNALQMREGEQMVAGSNSSYDCRVGGITEQLQCKKICNGHGRLLNLFFSIPEHLEKVTKCRHNLVFAATVRGF